MEKITKQQLDLLKKPLPQEAISQHPTKPYLSTIKAIYVVERFNEVFGLGGWFINNEVVEAGENNIVIKATFKAPEFDIVVPDIFGGNDNPDRGDAYKGACTDALTKIGSYLYVGMDVFKGLSEKIGNAQNDMIRDIPDAETPTCSNCGGKMKPSKFKKGEWYCTNYKKEKEKATPVFPEIEPIFDEHGNSVPFV